MLPMRAASRQCNSLLRREPRLLSRRWKANRGFASVQDTIPITNGQIQNLFKKEAEQRARIEGYTPQSTVSGTITIDGKHKIKTEDLVSQLPTLSLSNASETDICHAVILLSRSHATLLSDHERFLRPALQKLFLGNENGAGKLSEDAKVDVLAAVVDKIPEFAARESEDSEDSEDTGALAKQSEADGLAFYAADSPCILPDLWDAVDPGPKKLRIGDKRQSTISFGLTELVTSAESDEAVGVSTTMLKLPLANTVFQTGSEFTISASRWTLSLSGTALESSWRLDPKDRTILLPTGRLPKASSTPRNLEESTPGLAFPLLPLTSRREIKSGMGNIIRQLLDVEQEGLPASSELEQAVSDYFTEQNVEPHLVSVWALLIPKALVDRAKVHVDNLQKVLTNKSDVSGRAAQDLQLALSYLIMHGATLHRVLSGGGGWGAKAGLLSLDPSTDFGEESSVMPTAFDLGLELTGQDTSEVGRLAKPGDSVQFFLPHVRAYHDSGPTLDNTNTASSATDMTFRVGVAAPSEESLDETEPEQDSETHLSLYPGCFGALSEDGFSYRNDRPTTSIQTKIDVPGAKFAFRS